MISIICANNKSNYFKIPALDIWTKERDAYLFTGSNPVITHAPCAQWSKLKHFAHENKREKDLAVFCFSLVKNNGGIFEHPAGSSFFKHVSPGSKLYSIDQSWFGFPCRKRTYLFFQGVKPLAYPIFGFPYKKVTNLSQLQRSQMTLPFCQWLVDCVAPIDILSTRLETGFSPDAHKIFSESTKDVIKKSPPAYQADPNMYSTYTIPVPELKCKATN